MTPMRKPSARRKWKPLLIPCAVTFVLIIFIWFTWLFIDYQRAWYLFTKIQSAPAVFKFPINERRIRSCKNEVLAETPFAFVSMISNSPEIYALSAAKLASSIRAWTNADLIMMSFDSIPLSEKYFKFLTHSGWKVCVMPTIEGPPSKVQNRYLEGKMYSKFNAWSLIDYEAVLVLDSDILVLGDPTPLFAEHYLTMRSQNISLAAVTDQPKNSTCRVWNNVPDVFNAGVLLVIPSLETFHLLNRSITAVNHNAQWAEQRLLNVMYRQKLIDVYFLPFIFNANMICRSCERALWDQHEDDIRITHFTVAKAWTYSMQWTTWQDPFMCWWWNLREYCLLWDMMEPRA